MSSTTLFGNIPNINNGKTSSIGGNFLNGGVVDGATIGNDAIFKIVYPSYLKEDEYANRRMTFIASTKATQHYDTDSLQANLNIVRQSIQSAVNMVSEAIGGSTLNGGFFDMVTKACITLPLPNTFAENLQHSWGETEGLVSSVAGGVDTKIGGKADVKAIGENQGIKGKGKSIANIVLNTMGKIDIGKIAGMASENYGIRKPLLDPNYWQNYTGTKPRTFTFETVLIPQSQADSEMIKQIILKFKEYSSPSLVALGVALLSPHYWDIIISNAEITNMYRMDNLVLTNMVINYGQDGGMALHGDGFPKQITMSLSFTESHVTYAQNYRDSFTTWYTDRNNQFTDVNGIISSNKNNVENARKYGLTVNPSTFINASGT